VCVCVCVCVCVRACVCRCFVPYTPFHNAQVLIYNAVCGAEKATAELWSRRLARFPEHFGPNYETDGAHVRQPSLFAPLSHTSASTYREIQRSSQDPASATRSQHLKQDHSSCRRIQSPGMLLIRYELGGGEAHLNLLMP